MANIKGVYIKVSLQKILDKLKNTQNNKYKEIKIEYIKKDKGHYIFENNNELIIVLNEDLVTDEEKKIFIEIQNRVIEYNKSNKAETTVDSTYNYSEYTQEEQEDFDEYMIQLRNLKEFIKLYKKRGEYIDIGFTNESSFDGIPIKGEYIVINGTSLNIDKIRNSPDFDWIINDYIPKYNKEIKFKNSNSPISKVNHFKESLKYNIDKIKEKNNPKIEEQSKKIKRNFKKVAKTLKCGCKYILSQYNKINKETKKRVVAMLLSATALLSAGSIGYDVGRATEYVEGQGYENVDDAIDYLKEKRIGEVEAEIEDDLGKDVEVIARQEVDSGDEIFINTGVKSGYDRYSIPNELEEILEDIAIDAQSGFGKKIKLSKLLKLQEEIEDYFSKYNLNVKKRSILDDELVAKRNRNDTALEK